MSSAKIRLMRKCYTTKQLLFALSKESTCAHFQKTFPPLQMFKFPEHYNGTWCFVAVDSFLQSNVA